MDILSGYKAISYTLNENPGLHITTYLEHITHRTAFGQFQYSKPLFFMFKKSGGSIIIVPIEMR